MVSMYAFCFWCVQGSDSGSLSLCDGGVTTLSLYWKRPCVEIQLNVGLSATHKRSCYSKSGAAVKEPIPPSLRTRRGCRASQTPLSPPQPYSPHPLLTPNSDSVSSALPNLCPGPSLCSKWPSLLLSGWPPLQPKRPSSRHLSEPSL